MKQTIGALICQAPIHDFFDEAGEALLVIATFSRQAPDHPGDTCHRPAVSHAPEVLVFETPFTVIPDVRKKSLLGIPQPLPIAFDLRERLIVIP